MHTLLYLLYAASFSLLVATDAWADDPVARFDLPSEPLAQALIDFYHQSGISPGFAATPQMDEAKSSPVSGEMASSMALTLLLKGTGFTFRFDTGDSVDVIPAEEPPDGQEPSVPPARPAGLPSNQTAAAAQDRGRLEQVNVTEA